MIKAIFSRVRLVRAAGVLLYLQALTTLQAGAQNLIPNPSFESMNACPTGWHEGFPFPSSGSPTFSTDWYMPSAGTSDYFNACAPQTPIPPLSIAVSTPSQFMDYQLPRTGVAYAGAILNNLHCEYIQSPLMSPLPAGHRIFTSFWINSRNSSCGGADQIGAYFSVNPIELPSAMILPFSPQIESQPNVIYYDTLNWMQVSDTFTAAGNEQWVTFGFFKPYSELNKNIVCPNGGFGIGDFYYFYDDICVLDIDGPASLIQTKDTSLCGNQPIDLSAQPGEAYFWSNGSHEPTISITQAGTYWVTTVDARQCVLRRDTIKVTDASTVIPLNIGSDTIICDEKQITLNAQHQNFSDYIWSTGATTPSISVSAPGTYWVRATADCSSGLDSISIAAAEDCNQCLFFPNAFSPNNDRRNDLFKPSVLCDVGGYKIAIYNRFGQLVFSSNNVESAWDGNYNGKKADVGVYYFNVIFQNRNSSKMQKIMGDLSLIW